jgi:hypothetical protein
LYAKYTQWVIATIVPAVHYGAQAAMPFKVSRCMVLVLLGIKKGAMFLIGAQRFEDVAFMH